MAGPVMGPPSQLQHRAGGWQEAGRSQQEQEGTLFRDQGTPSEPELMDFWAVTCRGSGSCGSNWDLL